MFVVVGFVLVVALVGVGVVGRRRLGTVIAVASSLPVLGLGLLGALFHDDSEEQPPPPPLSLENDSDDAVYLVTVGSDVPDADLSSAVLWNGLVRPESTRTFRLSYENPVGEVCTDVGRRSLLVRSVTREHRDGSNHLDDDGIRQYPLPGTDDVEVVHEWGAEGQECFALGERHVRWDGERVGPAPPPDEPFDLPGWLAPLLVAGGIATVLIGAGVVFDRVRARRSAGTEGVIGPRS